jgi:hypothetical protein
VTAIFLLLLSVQYVGSKACGTCHAAIYRQYSQTDMAHPMSPASRLIELGLVDQPVEIFNQKHKTGFGEGTFPSWPRVCATWIDQGGHRRISGGPEPYKSWARRKMRKENWLSFNVSMLKELPPRVP